ncbi:hypothetical protein ACJJIQ_13570 [Microbulbifer sp. ANSA003]|uniref:hypothetical protein n=1 Tax=Microbulbifer sp. ANSA003 TaxID=3243360 RepID=UPI004042843B
MIINTENHFEVGNRAMSSVLLLYYHMIDEGGFANGQTAYINYDDFNGYEYIKVKLTEENGESLGINEHLLQQGATIWILCILHNHFTEDDAYRPSRDNRLVKLLEEYGTRHIPEIYDYLNCILPPTTPFEFQIYSDVLTTIYEKYVKGFFIDHISHA